jgi:hypothetical protein
MCLVCVSLGYTCTETATAIYLYARKSLSLALISALVGASLPSSSSVFAQQINYANLIP